MVKGEASGATHPAYLPCSEEEVPLSLEDVQTK